MATRSANVARKLNKILQPTDNSSSVFINRNPRNLERLRIAYKPNGYHLEKPGRDFWHKVQLDISSKYLTAKLVHFNAGTVVQASTTEWAIKKQLFKTNDTSAYINLAKVFASRCLMSGFIEMKCDVDSANSEKLKLFLSTLKENGLILQEAERFLPHRPWDEDRPEKPWEIKE